MFTVVQRFRSDLGLYVHLHCLATDGAVEEHSAGVRFLPAPAPTSERLTLPELELVLGRVHVRVRGRVDAEALTIRAPV